MNGKKIFFFIITILMILSFSSCSSSSSEKGSVETESAAQTVSSAVESETSPPETYADAETAFETTDDAETEPETSVSSAAITENETAPSGYYITMTGDRYHTADCGFIKDKETGKFKPGVRPMTEEDMTSGSYLPCERCIGQK